MAPRLSRRQFTTGLSASALALIARGPTSPTAAATSGTLIFGYPQKTSFSHFMHLRPYAGGEDIYSREFANAKLIAQNEDVTGYFPDLAETWTYEGTTLTFQLRKGLTWHDGQPFTAQDVDFTFHMMSMPGMGPYNRGNQFAPFVIGQQEFIDGGATRIEGLRVVDDWSVSFDLFEPFNLDVLFTQFNTVCIAPRHVLEVYLDRDKAKDILASEWATTAKHIGLGPFRVVEYVPDQRIVYEPFEGYYRGKPKLERLIYVPYQDGLTAIAALEAQECDVAPIPETEYARLQQLDYLDVHLAQTQSLRGSPFNVRSPLLGNKLVRQGLLHAIDRETIAKTLWAGTASVPDSPIFVPRFGYSPNLKKYPYDPDKAKQLLDEGGWDASKKLRWWVTAAPADESVYAAINGYWAEVGVQAEYQITGQDLTVVEGADWDLAYGGYYLSDPDLASVYIDARRCTVTCVGYRNPRLEELIDRYGLQLADDEAKQLVWELQDIVTEEALVLGIVWPKSIWGINKRVKGFGPDSPNTSFTNDWHMEQVTVD